MYKSRVKLFNNSSAGSYIVEAALSLPVFILCVVALALIINIISICENIGFVTSVEVKDLDLDAYKIIKPISLCNRIEENVLDQNSRLSNFKVKRIDYLFSKNGIDDLIGIKTSAEFKAENSIGIKGQIIFDENLLSRGFTGKKLAGNPLDAEEFQKSEKSVTVIVFPKYGIRFHTLNCRYVKKDYAGEEYKLEMEKADAVRKGYTPCLICGGVENQQQCNS